MFTNFGESKNLHLKKHSLDLSSQMDYFQVFEYKNYLKVFLLWAWVFKEDPFGKLANTYFPGTKFGFSFPPPKAMTGWRSILP